MPIVNINRVCLTGNLTADPELRNTSAGTAVCELRIAVNSAIKRDGQWDSKPNYFQVNTWGGLAENASKFLSKGSPVAIDGRLEWQKWETKEGGTNSRVVVVADTVQFLNRSEKKVPETADVPDSPKPSEPVAESGPADNDDIPF